MQKRASQGSVQLQGEAPEVLIEDWLKEEFPDDNIKEVKKGARGADCLQFVNTRSTQNCGTIYYESKRTKDFQPSWIEKFKADIRDKEADIGVLVTEVMPSDMDRLGLKDGVWICNYSEFKGLCAVLRESIIRLSTAISSQENKGDKMDMLYSPHNVRRRMRFHIMHKMPPHKVLQHYQLHLVLIIFLLSSPFVLVIPGY